jgi:hypothetical protein
MNVYGPSRVALSYLCMKGSEGRAMKKLMGAVIAAGAAMTLAPAAHASPGGAGTLDHWIAVSRGLSWSSPSTTTRPSCAPSVDRLRSHPYGSGAIRAAGSARRGSQRGVPAR